MRCVLIQFGAYERQQILSPGMKGVATTDLKFQEFATYIHGALRRQGFVVVPNVTDADVIILVMYGRACQGAI